MKEWYKKDMIKYMLAIYMFVRHGLCIEFCRARAATWVSTVSFSEVICGILAKFFLKTKQTNLLSSGHFVFLLQNFGVWNVGNDRVVFLISFLGVLFGSTPCCFGWTSPNQKMTPRGDGGLWSCRDVTWLLNQDIGLSGGATPETLLVAFTGVAHVGIFMLKNYPCSAGG